MAAWKSFEQKQRDDRTRWEKAAIAAVVVVSIGVFLYSLRLSDAASRKGKIPAAFTRKIAPTFHKKSSG
ncbi:MAG: hypothetical protein KGJ84_17205 [Elusimicrobia bacterium]|nr:hypothetical protein [Elusimicrobiota bacterium]